MNIFIYWFIINIYNINILNCQIVKLFKKYHYYEFRANTENRVIKIYSLVQNPLIILVELLLIKNIYLKQITIFLFNF